MIICQQNTWDLSKTPFFYMSKSIRMLCTHMDYNEICEIRIRLGQAVVVHCLSEMVFLSKKGGITTNIDESYKVSFEDIQECIERITLNSRYAFEDEIRRGFITLEYGHRVGIGGSAVESGGNYNGAGVISNIKDISSLNYRFAHEVVGCAEKIIQKLTDSPTGITSTMIISPPGYGKTTILRDIARMLSKYKKVTIIDERGEIAAMNAGLSPYNMGVNCDVISLCPKPYAMNIALRALSPEIIITDELGSKQDILLAKEMALSGVSLIASVHAHSYEQAIKKPLLKHLFEEFSCFVTLGDKTVENIIFV